MRIIRQSSFVSVPWKNGGGITHEAIRVPAVGDPFHWRVSVAEIGASGPFSDFAVHQRFMVLLKGAGVVLTFSTGAASSDGPVPDTRRLLEIGDMVTFDGALATRCELVGGPCVDLNLMVSKTMAGVQARVEVLRGRRTLSPDDGESMLVFPVDAGVELEGREDTEVLEPWDLALLSGPGDGAVTISAAGQGAEPASAKVFLATLKSS